MVIFKSKLEVLENTHLREQDMGRRVGPNGEALVWCRKCSDDIGCRLESKLMNRCRPENE